MGFWWVNDGSLWDDYGFLWEDYGFGHQNPLFLIPIRQKSHFRQKIHIHCELGITGMLYFEDNSSNKGYPNRKNMFMPASAPCGIWVDIWAPRAPHMACRDASGAVAASLSRPGDTCKLSQGQLWQTSLPHPLEWRTGFVGQGGMVMEWEVPLVSPGSSHHGCSRCAGRRELDKSWDTKKNKREIISNTKSDFISYVFWASIWGCQYLMDGIRFERIKASNSIYNHGPWPSDMM